MQKATIWMTTSMNLWRKRFSIFFNLFQSNLIDKFQEDSQLSAESEEEVGQPFLLHLNPQNNHGTATTVPRVAGAAKKKPCPARGTNAPPRK